MANYKISPRSKTQLLEIEEYTSANFGTYQADAYITGFEHAFQLIANFPGIGLPADELCPGLRRHRYQKHYIFFSEEADHILIRVILHTSQDLKAHLFD